MKTTLLLALLLTATNLIAQQANTVGIANLTEHSLNDAKAYARSKSKDCIIVLYCGNDMENAKEVIAGAEAALDEGANVKGVVLAPPDPKFTDGSESFAVYVHGVCLDEKNKDATIRPEWMMREIILHIKAQLSSNYDG